MALTTRTAKQLCSAAELELFTESLSRNIRDLNTRSVKARISRARKLRDKYSSQADQQVREIRGKQPQRRKRAVTGNENTRRKERLFAETLDRYETFLAKLEAAAAASEKQKKVSRKKTAAKKVVKSGSTAVAGNSKPAKKKVTAAARANTAPKSTSKTTGKAKQSRFTAAGQTRIQKHVSAQNRRRQAKRDSR